jgi:PAS domain S-box-containing protein
MNGTVNLDPAMSFSQQPAGSWLWRRISTLLFAASLKNDEYAGKARLLMKVLITMLITTSLACISAFLEPQNKVLTTITFYGVTFIIQLMLVILLRMGKVLITGWAVVIFLWTVVAFATLFFGGLQNQIPVVFVVSIMFMGSFLGGRAAIILSAITISFLGVVAYLEANNLMPQQLGPVHSPLNAWTALCIAFLLMAVLLHNSITAIKESEERYQLAVQGSAAGLWDWNIETKEIYYSNSFKEMLGYAPEEFPYHYSTFREAIHPDDLEIINNAMERHFQSADCRYDVEFRIKTKNDSYRWYHSRGEAVRTKSGRPQRMVGSMIDITERKLAEEAIALKNEELLKTNTELDQFVYSASHDLRAPISSLLGLIEVARLDEHAPSIKTLLDMQERSILKLDKFISDIVSYSRNNRVGPSIEPIDFKAMIDTIYDQLQQMEHISKIKIITEIDPGLTFETDKKRLSIILNNLITNAVIYSDLSKAEPFVKVLVKKSEGGIHIHVIDNGDGIDEKHLPRIFEMFYRGCEKSAGSGIGLYIAKEIVQKLQGNIEVRTKVGEGSEFVVELRGA